MKLVINIDEKMYEDCKTRNTLHYSLYNFSSMIANGTPLSKGHGNLKDADIYKAEVYKYIAENKNSDDLYLSGCGDGAYHALHIYDCIPTIIEADKAESEEQVMPKSLRCKIKHLCYNGTLTEKERDRILKALDQEDVLGKIREEVEAYQADAFYPNDVMMHKRTVLQIIDKYREGGAE